MNVSTLKPGLLVSLKTTLSGNVSYRKFDIDPDHSVDGTATRVAKWETERTIADAAEFELARKTRSEAVYAVAKVCASTAFGMLCPEDKASELDAAIKQGRALVDAFNETAKITRISLYVISGRVAADDVEAIRAIRAEVGGLLNEMRDGVTNLTPDKVRDAAKRAKEIASMLTDDNRQRVDDAVDAARSAARAITKAAKAGEVAALEIDASIVATLNSARLSFLDVEDAKPIAEAQVTARVIDLETVTE